MQEPKNRGSAEPMMPLAKLVDLDGIQETPQLAAAIKRRISAEAELLLREDDDQGAVDDRVSFLEETICELVELVASLETEAVERRRLKRIPR